MTGVMFAAQRLGLLGELPPRTISRAGLRALRVHESEEELDVLATANHFAFGAACGALFAAASSGPARRAPLVLAGIAFGTAVWIVSYAGWVPALRILPPPTRDRPDRPAVMLAAHWVFGATLGALVRARGRGRSWEELAADPEAPATEESRPSPGDAAQPRAPRSRPA
jgi:hypothetical protein